MHVNAGSLVANILNVCLNLASLKHKFSVVAVTETWTNSFSEKNINIPGYDKIIKSRENRVGGGVTLFVDSDLDVKVKTRRDLDCQNSSICECLFVQITQPLLKCKDVIIGVVYRPPGTKLETFYDCFFPIVEQINSENRPCYILGDFNIDLLVNSSKHGSQIFLDNFFQIGSTPELTVQPE